jgi:hypothetical protein
LAVSWAFAALATGLATAQPTTTNTQRPKKPRLDVTQACSGTRLIAILKDPATGCPTTRAFSGTRLFPPISPASAAPSPRGARNPQPAAYALSAAGAAPAAVAAVALTTSDTEDKASTAPPAGPMSPERAGAVAHDLGLDRFCSYDLGPQAGSQAKPRMPAALLSKFSRVDSDCNAIGMLGSADLDEMAWKELSSQFLEQVGQPAFAPNTPTQQVRLAFVDTQPTGKTVPTEPGCSKHGYTLAHIARHLTCDTTGDHCAAQITTQLALKLKSPPVSAGKTMTPLFQDAKCAGGFLGSIGDLAAGIQAAVDSWVRDRPSQRLILNLSVGWDGDQFGGTTERASSDLKASIQAVYRALQYASRLQVLVVAAAGNATPGPQLRKGPILPAGWEATGLDSAATKGQVMPPLVYAAGGVRRNDGALANARPEAVPPRVAYADHAVVSDLSGRPTAILTGTSVAAAVVSSAAARVWNSDPTLDPQTVMRKVQDSGRDIAMRINFGGTAPGQLTRRICLEGPKACTAPPHKLPTEGFSPTVTVDASVASSSVPTPSDCNAAKKIVRVTFQGAPPNPPLSYCPCDDFDSSDAQPWTFPQPGSNPCPACVVDPTGGGGGAGAITSFNLPLAGVANVTSAYYPSLFIQVPDDWWMWVSTLRATTLEVVYGRDAIQTTHYSYAINQDLAKSGPTTLKVTNLQVPTDIQGAVPIQSATLNFVMEREGKIVSVSSPLFLGN